jgi:uncharacterized protein YbcI
MIPLDSQQAHGGGTDAVDARRGGTYSAAISNMVVGVLREYTGRGPTKARTYISDNLVTCVLGDSLTKGEQVLVAAGQDRQVLDLRHTFQETMRDDLVGGVETITERKVIAFVSSNHIDPDLAVETFVLEPTPEHTSAQVGSSSARQRLLDSSAKGSA